MFGKGQAYLIGASGAGAEYRMGLQVFLEQKENRLVDRWFSAVVDAYPTDTARFLKREKDPFANPVGNITLKSLSSLFKAIVDGAGREVLVPVLDPILRIRAIQDFSPSQATGFILLLKKIIAEDLKQILPDEAVADEAADLNDRIDELLLMAFDIYFKCREKIYELKANEVRNRTFMAFERAGLVRDDPEAGECIEERHRLK